MVQIFISYAREDDELPPDAHGRQGFVSYLHDQLKYEFKRLGEPKPKIWRDVRNIKRGDSFEELIEGNIESSDIFLVILSRNWMQRPWCRRELESFSRRWMGGGEFEVRQRIVFAAKHKIEPSVLPPLMQGKEGYDFFYLDPEEDVGHEEEFFDRGEVRDRRYHERVRGLATFLWHRGVKYGGPAQAESSLLPGAMESASTIPVRPSPVRPTMEAPVSAPAKGHVGKAQRVIYVAQPAADMRQSYERVVAELEARNFEVVPSPGSAIPYDGSAVGYIDQAVGRADFSIHLLGEKMGYAPEDEDPILKLQLARAAVRAKAETEQADTAFRRLIWAPRVPTSEDGSSSEVRDSLSVLEKFHRQLPSDKIEGDSLSKFIDYMIQQLDRVEVHVDTSGAIQADTRVYINHRIEDTDYAIQFGKVLQERNVEVIWPSFSADDPAELRALHRENLREADSVLLCWANAPDMWVNKSAQELRSWRDLGRAGKFACRLLVAAPPPGQIKKRFVSVPPRSDIDVVLDLTSSDEPSPDAFDPLMHPALTTAP